ncbi:dynein heavy chain 14, axonemal, partial [Python bivittatus]|uniref:Dynein heavy chain 14, axonemal n=1 Tax=Python bivittatus TaxID=176946 RepID=A0A9F2R3W3_PYTBI
VRNPVLLLIETLPKTAKEMIENLIEEAAVISENILKYANYQNVLDSSITDMKSVSVEKLSHRSQAGDSQRVNAELSEIQSELALRKLLWDSHEEWTKLVFKWKHTIFWNLDVDIIQRDVNRFMQIIHILEKGLPENTILPAMKRSLMDFKESLPIIISLRNPSLQRRHWETIQNIVGQPLSWDKRLTLEKILELNEGPSDPKQGCRAAFCGRDKGGEVEALRCSYCHKMFQYGKDINDISIRATRETTLEEMLKKIIALWHKTDFHLCPYHTESSSTCIISSVEDIITLLEESLMTMSTIKSSCFVEPIKNLVYAWDHKINLISCTLEEWLTCQRHWIYLEPIFHASEIKRQLPEEASLFSVVDNKWKEIMKFVGETPNALKATTTSGIFEILQSNNASLEKIQKALEEYLEVKRMIFPRFYFLSNVELLDIVAESKNPDAVQPHLMKCFSNMKKLYIRTQPQRPPVVLMFRSAEGEILLVPKGIRIRGPVEQWLRNVESTMYNMVRKKVYGDTGTVMVMEMNLPGYEIDAILLAKIPKDLQQILDSHIKFTQKCEAALSSSNSKKEMIEDRDDLINLLEQLTEIASDVLSYHKQSTLEALASLYIHNRDILSILIDQEINDIKDFEWTRQLHYKWHEHNLCTVIQGYASFEYGYEYLGCSPRLVITPLTDRCWLSITGALQLNLGCCLAGPAGTGKSETVKDLSKALGKFCLSYNCSEGLDDKMMGKLFFGLVQSGVWCCFDEFNRIDIEVLSAIASHLQAIKAAKDSFSVRFILEGKEIRLKQQCAIFITMNPGYKGRVELPDNLKSLFRPMSMVIPDYELITEIMLFSEGFKSAKLLSGKIVNLYQLSSKRLSQQDHYDFGMRAIKTVLIRVGQKRQELKIQFSATEETLITIGILKEVNLPKLIAEDVPIFEDIITDLFTGMEVPKVNPKRLESAISLAIQHLSLQPWENQIEKVIQLYNQIMARVGVMLVGPTGGGKTTIRTILEKALIILPLVDMESSTKLDIFQNISKRSKVDTFVINPKCITVGELFGQTNPSTMEWSDGLLSSAVRGFAKLGTKKTKKKDPSIGINSDGPDLYTLNTVNVADAVVTDETVQSAENIQRENILDWQWIILDGPVDPVWIENLNSVLDDSRTLCLANSERIYLSPGIRMIFEVDSVSQASPATISRCAMVYVDPTDLGWEPYVKTWLETISEIIPENSIEYLESLFHSSIKLGLAFLNKHKKMQAFPVHQMGIVVNICRIIGSFIHVMNLGQGLQCSKKRRQSSTVSFSNTMSDSPQFLNEFSSFSGRVPSIMKKRGDATWFWEKEPNKVFILLGKIFIFAFTWAIGGILKREEEHEGETLIGINTSQDELARVTRDFNYLVRDLFERKPPANIQFPSGDKTVFDYFVDLQTGEFEPWGHLVPSTQFLIQKETSDISDSDNNLSENQEKKTEPSAFIPNIDTIRHSFLASLLLLTKHPVLIIVSALSLIREDGDLEEPSSESTKSPIICKLQLGAHTTAAQTKALIIQKLILKSKDTMGAPQSKQAVLFIDDLNMPIAEEYGSKPPLELIRQFVELRGFYDIKQLEWKQVQDVALVACCTPLSVGSNEISARLLSNFCILVLPATSLQSLQRIFQVRLGTYFYINRFLVEVQKCTDNLTCCSIALYYRMLHKMLPTPAKRHYTFNLRDLFKVLEGLLQAHKSIIVSKETTALFFIHESTRVFHDRLVDHTEKETFYQFLSDELNNYFKIGLEGNGKATCASLACYVSECSIYRLSTTYSYSYANFQQDIKNVYKQAGAEGKRTVLLITNSDIIQESFLEDLSCILKSGQVPSLFEKDELDNIVESLTSVAEMANHSNKIDDIYSFFLQRVRHNLHIVLTISPTGVVFHQHCRTYPAILNCCTVDWYENWPEEALCHVAKSYFSQNETFRNENLRNVLIHMTVNIHKNVSMIIEKYLKETKRHYYITPKSYLQFINTFSTILQTTKEKILSERACYHSGLTKILDATSQITDMQNELLVLGPQIESKSKEIEELVAKLHKDTLIVEQVRTIVKQDEETMAVETKIVEAYAKQATEELNAVLPSLEKALSALDALDKNHIAEIRVYTHPPPLVLTVMNAVCVLLQKKPNWTTAKLLLADPGFLKKLITLDIDNLPEKVFLQLKKYVRSPDFSPVKVGLVSIACCSICQWILALDHYHIVKKFVDPKQAKVAEAEELLNRALNKLAEKQRTLALIELHQQNLEALYDESIAEQEKLAARKNQTTRRLHSASILSIALKDEMERWKESVNNLDQRLQGIVGDTLISAASIVYSGMLSAGYRQQLVNDSLKLCNENNILVSPNYSLVNCMTDKNEVRRWQNAGLPLDQYSTENAILIKHGRRWPLLIDPERQAYKWICQMEGGKLRQIHITDVNYLKILEYSLQFGESVLLQDFPETLDSNLKPILKKEVYKKGGQEFIRIGGSEIQYNSDFRLYLTTQKANPNFLPATCNIVTVINFILTFHGLQDQLLSAVVNKKKPELEKQHCELMESISIDLAALREYEQKSLKLLQKTNGHLLDDQDLIDNLQQTKITSSEIFQRVADSAATEVTIEGLRKAYLPIATRGAVLYFVISDLVHINHVYQFSLNWFHKIFVDSTDDVKKSDISLSDSISRTKISRFRKQNGETSSENENDIDHFKIYINDMMETLTHHVYETVSSALFSKHKLCFAFLLCTAIMKNNCGENLFTDKLGFISENQWKFFLHSSMIANISQSSISDYTGLGVFKKTPPLPWISEMMWKECQYMSTYMSAFSLLCNSLSTYSQQWRTFLDSENVYNLISTSYRPLSAKQDSQPQVARESEDKESTPLIFPWEKLSPFERLTLIKVLRSEMLNSAVQGFISEKLGARYLQTGGINLKRIYEESDSTTPLILIHTHGIDIAAVVLRFAQEIKSSTKHVTMISLGRGQGSKAEELIYKAQILSEQWAFLQNCHLAASFMPRLCKIVDSFMLPDININPGFRLWLSSTPDTSLPIPILRRGLKIVIETPQGLKGTLLQTFGLGDTGIVTEAIFNKTNCGPSWKTLLFSLCFFNAVIHERKKYGVLGWNIPYEFNSSDLEISIKILEMLLEKHQKIPWTALHYLTGEVTYGGHVTDNWDHRCLLTILDNFYNPSVLQEHFVYTADEVYGPISELDSLKDCRAYLRSLPEMDSPEPFGMHHCAERVYLKAQAQLFIDSIVSTQPAYCTDTISGRKSQDEIVLEIASDILITLPLTVETMEEASANTYESREKVTLRSFMSGPVWAALVKATEGFYSFTSSPLLAVLRQEIDQCNNLLYIIIKSLHELQQGLKGEIIFTSRLEELYNSILKGKVADLWEKHSFKTNKSLGSWIDDLIIQVNFFAVWADRIITFMQSRFNDLMILQRQSKIPFQIGENPDFHDSYQGHPSFFWLPGFFFPHGFLIAVCQNYARLNKIPVDSLTFTHEVLPLIQDKDLSCSRKESVLNKAFMESSWCGPGIKVYGLYIDGACWNPSTQALDETELHRRFYPLPDIQFLPQKITFCPSHSYEEERLLLYECPLYKTSQRSGMLSSTGASTNFITVVNLPSLVTPSHWILRGVALLCQMDD